MLESYLASLQEKGYSVDRGILYGSYARGDETKDSDIDVILLSPEFERVTSAQRADAWRTAYSIDWRIEPVLYGEKQFEENDWHPLILVAKSEGIEIRAPRDTTHLKAKGVRAAK